MADKKLKTIPRFDSEDEEREFWATHDSGDYVDWSKAEVITERGAFPNLKRTAGLIPLRLDDVSTKELKALAKERSIDLGALAAQYVNEGIRRDAHHAAR
jgi:hypothetical protein